MAKKPNEIGFELNNGQTVKGPTELWLTAIITLLTPQQLEQVVKYVQENQPKPEGALYTADGRRVHFLAGNSDESDG